MSILKDESHLNMYFAITLPTIRFLPLILLSYGNSGTNENFDPKRFKAILWLIAGGTRGGPNRIKILNIIGTKSLNAHQIAKELKLDYKTITYHIKVLEKKLTYCKI